MKEDDKKVVFISFVSQASNMCEIEKCCEMLNEKDVKFYAKDLTGEIYNSVTDFLPMEFIMITNSVLQQFMISGSYDVLKHILIKLWNAMISRIDGMNKKEIPFAIKINGIPTIMGNENISVLIEGNLSDDLKRKIIDKTFESVDKLIDGELKLKERGMFYNAFQAHLFDYNFIEDEIKEKDIEVELRNKKNNKLNKTTKTKTKE